MMKVYETINAARLVTTIEHNASTRTITFEGGSLSPAFRRGEFKTSDLSLQKSIESSSGFNIDYRLLESIPTVKASKRRAKKRNTVIEDVTSKQFAIDWLSRNLDIVINPRTDIGVILDIANDKGFSFPNLQIR